MTQQQSSNGQQIMSLKPKCVGMVEPKKKKDVKRCGCLKFEFASKLKIYVLSIVFKTQKYRSDNFTEIVRGEIQVL